MSARSRVAQSLMMSLKFQTIRRVGSLFCGVVLIYWILLMVFDGMPSTSNQGTVNYQQVQRGRVSRIYETCHKYRDLLTSTGYADSSRKPVFLTSPQYNWSYCKIGKIASTMWTKFFDILHSDGEDLDRVLAGSRDDIHLSAVDRYIFGVKQSLFHSTRMVVSARNPYSRLFSAYIDRMYIPSLSQSILGEDNFKCKAEISFSEFLLQVAANTRRGKLDYHWSPVFHLCKPCELTPDFVFQQESAKEDFAHVINETKLEPHKLDILYEAIHIHTNWSAFALIDDVLDTYAKENTFHSLDCQSPREITIRLWKTFQIQGFISDKAPFPVKKYRHKSSYDNSDIFRKALLNARAQYPLTSKEKDAQRQKAMNEFYKTISPEVIKEVMDVFGVDFEMFGYSKTPPPW